MTEVVDDHLVGRDETADGGQALGEGTHDEVYLIGQAEMVAHAATLLSEDAQAVGLVHHDDHVVILVLELHNLRQLGQVSFHGEDAVHHDELDGVLGAAAQAALQVLHVVVPVVQALGEAEPAAVHDGGVVTVVADDEIVLGEELGNDAAVHGEAGGEHQGFVFAHKGGQFFFQLNVEVQRSVEETGAGAAGTVFLEGLDAGIDDTLVSGEPGIGVGTEHEDLLSVHGYFGSLFAGNLTEIRVDALLHHFLGEVIFGQSGV